MISLHKHTFPRLPAFTVLMILSLGALSRPDAPELQIGVKTGIRNIQDAQLKKIYGSGPVFIPYLVWNVSDRLGFELARETGSGQSGRVGIYREDSTLSLRGWEAALRLGHRFNRVSLLFIKLGAGDYAYTQDIDSEFVRLKVDHHAVAPLFGLGLDIAPGAGFRFSGEIKYVPLNVQPFDIEVDLGGFRLLIGVGYAFDLTGG